MHQAILYEVLNGDRVRCHVCGWQCTIPEGGWGHCQTRVNKGGKLFTIVYGHVSSLAVSPIEKKPVFHFFPGSSWLSLGTYGCNFRCPGCQNWELSHAEVSERIHESRKLGPLELVEMAKKHRCTGISWTYNEPTIWLEYTLDGARLAKKAGLFTNYVTNGFITPEALDTIGPHLDIFRVDIKGFSEEAYFKLAKIKDFSPILEMTKRAKSKWKMHVECVTNVTPTVNDDSLQLSKIARWICDELGPDTPWHVTQFVPHFEWSHLEATPVETLELAREIGLKNGLQYVYIGNIPGHPGENTYCHHCRTMLIEREAMFVSRYMLEGSNCYKCKTEIPGRF